MNENGGGFSIPVWLQPDGEPVSCLEKIKVLNENLEEIRDMAQDALEDAFSWAATRSRCARCCESWSISLENPYRGKVSR